MTDDLGLDKTSIDETQALPNELEPHKAYRPASTLRLTWPKAGGGARRLLEQGRGQLRRRRP
jgi:hypothetical protein